MTYKLRIYQEEAVTRALWSMQLAGNDLLVLSTGSGKSVICAEIAYRLNANILITAPSREITSQNISKMKRYVDDSEIGVYSASMKEKTVNKYTFATIGSIYKKPELFTDYPLMIVDECQNLDLKHLDGMYMTFINGVNQIRKREGLAPMKIIGLTATAYRNVLGYHKDERGQLYSTVTLKLLNRMQAKSNPPFWKRILINVGIKDLISQGYLCPFEYENRAFMTHEQMKLNKSETEFDLDDFTVKLGNRQQQVVECVLECEKKYKSVLVFCPSVSVANKYADAIPGAKSVSAKTPPDERDQIIQDFKSGKVKTVFNMNCLTTGFDHPELDCIINLRPTRSLALWVQLVGRGARIAEGKSHCQVIDYTDNVNQLGRIETVELRKEQFPEFESPMWEIFSTTAKGEERWHGRALYGFAIKPKSKSFVARAMAKKEGRLW